jgi:hypothetical protein
MFARISAFAGWINAKISGKPNFQWIVDNNRDGTVDIRKNLGGSAEYPIPGDYDGNGIDDFAIVRLALDRAGEVEWHVDTNRDGTYDRNMGSGKYFGKSTDYLVPGKWDTGATVDPAFVRAEDWVVGSQLWWYVDTNFDGVYDLRKQWGVGGDRPVPADYDGNGTLDFAVVRPMNGQWQWRVDTNRDGTPDILVGFGSVTDTPVPANYVGAANSRAELAVARVNGAKWSWLIDDDRDGVADPSSRDFGPSAGVPFPSDYSGDKLADFAVIERASTGMRWIVDTNRDGVENINRGYGSVSDWPILGNFDSVSGTGFALGRMVY